MHITELGGEYFKFDELRQELRGERTGIRYSIGSRVRVQVSRVDLDGRRIDFRLVREGDDLLVRAMKDKAGGRDAPAPRNGGRDDSVMDALAPRSVGKRADSAGGRSRKAGGGSSKGAAGKSPASKRSFKTRR